MEFFKRNTPEVPVSQEKDTEDLSRAERIRRALSERALIQNPPSREKVTIAYRGAEVPVRMGVASRVRGSMNREDR